MTIITVSVDETQQSQTIYCQQLDKFLQIYSLAQTDLNNQAQSLQTQQQGIITEINNIATLTNTRTVAQQAQQLP